MVAMDFFEASNFYDFFNQYCLNLLKNPTVRGLMTIAPSTHLNFLQLDSSSPLDDMMA